MFKRHWNLQSLIQSQADWFSPYFKRRDWRCVFAARQLHARRVLEISLDLSWKWGVHIYDNMNMSLFCIFKTGLHIFCHISCIYCIFFCIFYVIFCILFAYFLLHSAYYFAYLLSYSIFCILFCIFIDIFCIYMLNMQNMDLSLFCILFYIFYCIFCILMYIFYCIFCIFEWICCIFSAYSAYFLTYILKWIRQNNPVAFVHWLCSTRIMMRQAWTTSGRGPHQGSSLVTHKGLEPIGWTLNPRGNATLVWPVVPNPCLPADDEIVGSAIQLVLISDLFALDAPLVLGQVLQFFEQRISLFDAREWKIPEQMVNEGWELLKRI